MSSIPVLFAVQLGFALVLCARVQLRLLIPLVLVAVECLVGRRGHAWGGAGTGATCYEQCTTRCGSREHAPSDAAIAAISKRVGWASGLC